MAANGTITSRTGVLGILGHPVSHSLSPSMHNAALRAQGIDLVYLAFDVAPDQLSSAVTGLRALRFRGVNVTVPHKEAIVALLDHVEPAARRIGAVNTVVNEQGRLLGYNTDTSGFTAALRTLRTEGATGSTCFVAGSGGAARAVLAALVDMGAAEIRVHNRTHSRAVALCEQAAEWGSSTCLAVSDDQAASAAKDSDLLVNATSVGMAAPVKESPIPVDILNSRQIVIDLVYGPEDTLLVREARVRGAAAIDGKEMLVMQAAGSYELWTGRRAPVDVMKATLGGER